MTTPIIEIASKYLERVRPTGSNNITALCPFHADSTPSFALSLSSGLWICYACGAKGNLRQLLKGLGLNDQAIQVKYGATLSKLQQQRPPRPDPTKPLATKDPLPEEILGLFNLCPLALLDAGFTEETLQYFEVGFDKWHMRITYPMRDLTGQLLGINGRTVEEDESAPRYKVYTHEYAVWGLQEREVVQKSSMLWNAHNLYPYIQFCQTPELVVLVEGYKACMWVHQAGIPNVMATMGTSLSQEQKWILQKINGPVYLMFDNDAAGWSGMARVGSVISRSLPAYIVEYDAEQPDGLPLESVREAVQSAKSFHRMKREIYG